MPPKITRKAKDNGEVAETDDIMVPSPSASEDSYASSISSAPTTISLSSAMLESILAARDRNFESSIAARDKNFESSMMSILATLTPSLSAASVSAPPPPPPAKVQVKVPKWADDEVPSEYFSKLEKALTHNGVAKTSWGTLLPVYLSGKAQAALHQVPASSLDDYEAVKLVLLESLGDTPTSADRKWWSLVRQSGEDACAFYLRIRAIGIRRLQGLVSKEEILEKLVLSRFLSLLSSDTYSCTVTRVPKDGLEAARFVQELEESRAYSRKRQGWRQDHHSHSGRREPSSSSGGRSPNSSGSSSSQGGGSLDGSNSGSSVGSASSVGPSGDNFSENAPSSGGSKDRGNRRPIICHNCGEPGHILPNCPNVIRRVRELGGVDLGKTVDALLDGRPARVLVDTGAGRTIVHKDFVPRACYTGRSIRLRDWQGRYSSHKTAEIWIQVGEVKKLAVVAVDDSLDYPAALGSDLGVSMTRQLMAEVLAKLGEVDSVNVEVPMQVEPEVACDAPAVALEDIFCFSDSYFEPEVACDAPAVALEDIFCFSDSYFEPEVACDAPAVALEDIFCFSDSYFEPEVACDATVVNPVEAVEWPELDKVEFPLPDLGDAALEASVAPVSSDNFVVPMQQVDVKVDLVEAYVAPVDDVFEIFNFSDEFFEEDQADEVASGSVDSMPRELSDVFEFADSFFEADPVASVSEALPEPAKVVVDVTLVKEDNMSPELCRQSSSVLVDSDQRFLHCYSKTTGKLAPGCITFIDFLLCLSLRFLLFVPFVFEFSMCMCKFLVLLFFGALGPRAVLLFHRLDDPLCRMPEAPAVVWTRLTWLLMISPVGCQTLPLPMRPCLLVGCQKLPLLLRPLVKSKGGEMLWSPLPSDQAALQTFSWHASLNSHLYYF